MKKLRQTFQVPFQYEVLFSRGIFQAGNPILADQLRRLSGGAPPKLLFVVDGGLPPHYPQLMSDIRQYFAAHAEAGRLCGEPIVVPGGEPVKNTRRWADALVAAIDTHGIDRHSYLVALGGGAVLDMAGFAAAIAHRGVRHLRLPTTVLAQNDSGVGVKNAINAFGKKNFIGTFAPPAAVINDLDFLATLDHRDWIGGVSEAIKVSLLKDAAFFAFIEQHAQALAERDPQAMETVVYECARLHLEHIAGGDPFELGSSRPLDFGHWAAHKLEHLTDYQLRHGEAVAIGLALDVTYSHLIGLIDAATCERVIELIRQLGFDLYVPALETERQGEWQLAAGLNEFREHLGGRLTIMLLEEIGQGREVHEMNLDLVRRAVGLLKQRQAARPAGSLV